MSNNYVSNEKKENIINVFFSHLPKVAFFSSFFSVVFILYYLKRISMLEIFMQMETSVYVLACIFIFFVIVAGYIVLPLLYSAEFIFSKLEPNSRLREKLFLSIMQIAVMLPVLCLIFWLSTANSSCIIFIFLISFIGSVILFYTLNKEEKKHVISFIWPSIGTSLYFLSAFIFVVIMSDDNEAFWFVIYYLLFLTINNARYLFYNDFKNCFAYLLNKIKFCNNNSSANINNLGSDINSNKSNEHNEYHRWVSVFLGIVVLIISVDGFKMQRTILKLGGMAQDSSQTGWYLVKNIAVLDYFPSDYTIYTVAKKKNSDGDSSKDINYYIRGYLIFNVANVRIICPETTQGNKANSNNKSDFSQCLSLTDEDIKFMGRSLPNNASKIDVDSSTALMTVRALMTVKALMEVKLKAVKH